MPRARLAWSAAMTAIDAPAKVTAGGQLDRASSTSRAAVPAQRSGITSMRTMARSIRSSAAASAPSPSASRALIASKSRAKSNWSRTIAGRPLRSMSHTSTIRATSSTAPIAVIHCNRTRFGDVTVVSASITTNPALGSTRTRITPTREASTMRTSPSASATACARTVEVDVEVATPWSTGARPSTPKAIQASCSPSFASTVATAINAANAAHRRLGADALTTSTPNSAVHSDPMGVRAAPATSSTALASRIAPPTSTEKSKRTTRAIDVPTPARTTATAASPSIVRLTGSWSGPGRRQCSPAIGIRAMAPARLAVTGPAGTAARITAAAAATMRTWPCRRSGWSMGLANQAAPSAPRNQGTALSSSGFSPTGSREASKSATSSATAMVATRRVSPSKLELTRFPGRVNRSAAPIGPIAHATDPGSTSNASDHAAAARVPTVAACRLRPALPYAISRLTTNSAAGR